MSMGELSLLICHVKVWVGERCSPLLPTTATEEGTDPVSRGMGELATGIRVR